MYKENGANPLSGCLPLVAQLPVWFALLNVLRAMTENKALYGMTTTVVHEALKAKIFGVTIATKFLFQHPNSSGSDKLVIGITVVLSAVTTFLTVRQSMKRGMMQTPTVDDTNPMANAQKYMVYIAPLFALSGLYWQYGLVIYWLASNVWTLGQQYFLFKKIPPLNAVAADASAPIRIAGTSSAAIAHPAKGAIGPATAAKRPATTARRTVTTTRQTVSTAKPANAAKPASTAKPAGTAKAAGAAKPAAGTAKQPAGAAKAPAPAKKPSPAKTDAASLGIPPPIANGNGGGLRRMLGRKSAEPEPEPEVSEITVVRQQRVKQSRSKRTGKR
jgi:YidC/Oxa1 family membrane protein insertase